MLDTTTNTPVALSQQAAATAYERCQAPSGRRLTWHVATTYPRAERRAHAALHLKGFEAYLPLITVRWADRTWHTNPLFPGYLFVKLDLARPWHPVFYAPGVFSLLSTDGKPAICPDSAVEAVRSAVDAAEASPASQTPWKPGMPCSIRLGPLAGWPAVVTQADTIMVTLAVMAFGHLREITVPPDCLKARDE